MNRPPKHQSHVFRDTPTKGLVVEFAREIEADRARLPEKLAYRAEAAIRPLASDPKRAPFYAIGPELVPLTHIVFGRLATEGRA